MNSFNIRYYSPSDYSQLIALWQKIHVWGADKPDSNEKILDCQNIGGKLFIMENIVDKEFIGTGWLSFDGRFFHLHHFGIKPSFRKKGFGSELAKNIINYAKQRGYPVSFEIKKNNLATIKIYERLQGIQYPDYVPFVIENESQNIE